MFYCRCTDECFTHIVDVRVRGLKTRIDPFHHHAKQIGTDLIWKTNNDIVRSFSENCDNLYGFDNSDGSIIAIWRVKWKFPSYPPDRI